jgi:hypothetical protein
MFFPSLDIDISRLPAPESVASTGYLKKKKISWKIKLKIIY